jgi:hypothetical protein
VGSVGRYGSRSGGSFSVQARVCDTGQWWKPLAPSAVLLPACRGDVGKMGRIWRRVYSSLFKRCLYSSGGPLATPIHLAGRGSEEVEKGVSKVTEGGGGFRSAARACAVNSSARGLPRAGPLRLSPPARGRCGESDGGSSSFFGVGGVFFVALCAR